MTVTLPQRSYRIRAPLILWKSKGRGNRKKLHFPFLLLFQYSFRLPWKLSGLRWHWVKHSVNTLGKQTHNSYACHKEFANEKVTWVEEWVAVAVTSLSHSFLNSQRIMIRSWKRDNLSAFPLSWIISKVVSDCGPRFTVGIHSLHTGERSFLK